MSTASGSYGTHLPEQTADEAVARDVAKKYRDSGGETDEVKVDRGWFVHSDPGRRGRLLPAKNSKLVVAGNQAVESGDHDWFCWLICHRLRHDLPPQDQVEAGSGGDELSGGAGELVGQGGFKRDCQMASCVEFGFGLIRDCGAETGPDRDTVGLAQPSVEVWYHAGVFDDVDMGEAGEGFVRGGDEDVVMRGIDEIVSGNQVVWPEQHAQDQIVGLRGDGLLVEEFGEFEAG